MSHIIVIGTGLGGLPAAIELRSRLGKQHRITLIASSPHLEFTSVNPWIAVGWRKCAAARSTLQRPLELLGVQWLAEAVTGIDAPTARLYLRSGSVLAYDYLVIADEPVGAPEAIPGMELLGAARGVCTHQQAQHAWSEYRKFLSDPGPVIIAAVGSPRCAGHAYELSLILDADLRARGLRDLVPLTLVTCETSVGQMGLEGAESGARFMAHELRQRQIECLRDTQIVNVETGQLQVVDCAAHDVAKRRRMLPFKYAMIVPASAGLDALSKVPGLCDAQGTVLVDRVQRARRYPNIFCSNRTGAATLRSVAKEGAGGPYLCIEPLLSVVRAELEGDDRGDRSDASAPMSQFVSALE